MAGADRDIGFGSVGLDFPFDAPPSLQRERHEQDVVHGDANQGCVPSS
jgi:hypothetical protein